MAHLDQRAHATASTTFRGIAMLKSFTGLLSGMLQDCGDIERLIEARKAHF